MKASKVRPFSPCHGCEGEKEFSFKGCMRGCEKFLTHLKIVFQKDVSPCRDLRCGVPGAKKDSANCPEGCPLPRVYASRVGSGPRSVLGKPVVPTDYGNDPPWRRRY